MRQVVLVGEVLVCRRRFQMPAQADHVAVVPVAAGREAGEDQAVDCQVSIAGIYGSHVQTQIGVGVTDIGRVGQCAGDQHLVLPVVVPGNVMGIHIGNGGMVTGCTEEENCESKQSEKQGGRRELERLKVETGRVDAEEDAPSKAMPARTSQM